MKLLVVIAALHIHVTSGSTYDGPLTEKSKNVTTQSRMNVLFLVADDMRPELGCYLGKDFPSPVHPPIHSPNLDKLAAKSLLLKRAYVQVALCSPSRTSLLTGRRPDTTNIYTIGPYFRKVGGNFTTLPEYFKINGYETIGMGKIFHPKSSSGGDDPISWTKPYYHAPNMKYWTNHKRSHRAISKDKYTEKPLPDMQIAEHAIKVIQEAKQENKNFFIAVGFHKPHLPFVIPEEFLSYYPIDLIRLPPNPYAPVNLPEVAWFNYKEFRDYEDIKRKHISGRINTTLPDTLVRQLRRYYYSAVTYTDSLIGEVLKELEIQGLSSNTIISFWGDHGWQLGEHGEWCKQTNFELATHAPMMIHIPGLTDRGIVTEKLTEFVDLFPTLVDAAGLPAMPLCPPESLESRKVKLCREGTSLMPLISDPERKDWKTMAFSQFLREDFMGYSMRTDQYRYTEWVKFNKKHVPDWNICHGKELYDHKIDPEENYNHADEPLYTQIQKILSQQLRSGWRNVTDNSSTSSPHKYPYHYFTNTYNTYKDSHVVSVL